MQDELLTIGRFARLCRLSVKQLRRYDEMGLLAPVRVDARSGYRYYAPEQARDALTIALLREMDLPLAVIAQALAAQPESRAQILRAERDRLAERISRDQARLEMLETLSSPPSTSAGCARKRPYGRPISSGRQRHHKKNRKKN
ncbi:MerR family transcriptional regulator [Nonomuraea sp. NPDC048916]|uniref:MerR family transcriptional regulator n=1 Tax=Nonomuraea sp. NPDC048916 TaxID=3154232 RepID=UPI0033CC4259